MKSKSFYNLFIILLGLSSSNILAVEFSGNITLETKLFTESAAFTGQHGNNSSISFQPEFYHEYPDGSSFTFVPFVRADENDAERSHGDIRELTWVSIGENSEWRIGIRKVFWGVTESQHLVDIINQTDTVESVDGEEKLGQPMVNFSYITDYGSYDFFVMPYFRERTFPGIEGRLRSQPYVDTDTVFYESSDKEKHIDYALRWAHSIKEWDVGLSYFTGTSRDPRFVSGTDSAGNTVLNPFYDTINQWGIDLQATFNSWLWKLEAIYRSGLNVTNNDEYAAMTAGIEYTFFSAVGEATDIGLIAEYLRDERGNAATTPFQKDLMLGLRFTLNDEQSTDALIGVIKDLDNDAVVYTVEANRRLTEHLKLSFEARKYSNISSNDSLFSYLKDDYMQFELAYFF